MYTCMYVCLCLPIHEWKRETKLFMPEDFLSDIQQTTCLVQGFGGPIGVDDQYSRYQSDRVS